MTKIIKITSKVAVAEFSSTEWQLLSKALDFDTLMREGLTPDEWDEVKTIRESISHRDSPPLNQRRGASPLVAGPGTPKDRDAVFKQRMLAARIVDEHDGTAVRLKSALKVLAVNVERALLALEAGDRLDAHLIVNASSITEEIGRWNFARELLPLVEEDA